MVIKLRLVDHITVAQLERVLSRAALTMDMSTDSTHSLLIDASAATTYEKAARSWFAEVWGPANKKRVDKIAIVTKSAILRMAATTVGLIAGYRIDAFSSEAAATDWLEKKK